MKKKQSRSEARCEAFKLIFQLETNGEDLEFLIETMLDTAPESVDNLGYIKAVLYGVSEKKDELLEVISKNISGKWSVERISKVARTVLMLAIYEMLYVEDVPVKVAINEALNLAKTFDDPDSSSFVNGVLAGVVKELDK